MKRTMAFLLAVLLLFAACVPAAAEELRWGEGVEGWHYYPYHPGLFTLLNDDALWIVRGYFTGKEAVPDENGEAQECWMFTVKETLRGKPGSELAFRVPVAIDPELALRFNTGCSDLRPIPNLDYILVLNTMWIEGVQFTFFDSDQAIQHLPSVAFWEYHGLNSTAKDLFKEIKETVPAETLDELEEFFREAMPKDTSWQKPLIIGGWVVLGAGWAAWMLWALAKKERGMRHEKVDLPAAPCVRCRSLHAGYGRRSAPALGGKRGLVFLLFQPSTAHVIGEPQWYMVRGTVVSHGDYEGHEVFWFEITESLKGDLSGTVPFSYTAAKYAESGLACVIRLDGLTAPAMKLQQEYIMVVDMRCQTMFPYNLNMRPGEDGEIFREALDSTVFAFYVEDGEVHCGSPQLTEEINSMAKCGSLDDLESFFRQQMAPHSNWNMSALCIGAVLLVGWAMLVGRALYWRKRNME